MSLCGLNQRVTVSCKIKSFFFSVTGFQFEHFGPSYKNSAPVLKKIKFFYSFLCYIRKMSVLKISYFGKASLRVVD